MTVHDVAFERHPEAYGPVWRAHARRAHRRAAGVGRSGGVRLGGDRGRRDRAARGGARAGAWSSRTARARCCRRSTPACPQHFLSTSGDAEPRKGARRSPRCVRATTAPRPRTHSRWCSPARPPLSRGAGGSRGRARAEPSASGGALRRRGGARPPLARRGLRADVARGDGGRNARRGGANAGVAEVCADAALLVEPAALTEALARIARERRAARAARRARARARRAPSAGRPAPPDTSTPIPWP